MKPQKRMNFRKSSKRGAGSFPIQKFILQFFAIINGTLVMNSGKNLQYDFPKMRGGSKAVCNFSENSSVLVGPSVPNPQDYEQSSPALKVWSHESDKVTVKFEKRIKLRVT